MYKFEEESVATESLDTTIPEMSDADFELAIAEDQAFDQLKTLKLQSYELTQMIAEADDQAEMGAALKTTISTYGMTPSLMAFANHDGSLTAITAAANVTALESLDEAAVQIEAAKVVAALESYKAIEISTEGMKEWLHTKKSLIGVLAGTVSALYNRNLIVGTLSGFLVGGAAWVIDKAANKGQVYGSATDVKNVMQMTRDQIALAKKISAFPMPKTDADVERLETSIKACTAQLDKYDIRLIPGKHTVKIKALTRIRNEQSAFKLKMVPFASAGYSVESFRELVSEYADTFKQAEAACKELEADLKDYRPTDMPSEVAQVVGMTGKKTKAILMVQHEIVETLLDDAVHELRYLTTSFNSAKRFFKRDKS